jgi:hypothetical protein
MSKFLIPVDGSIHIEPVVKYLAKEFLTNSEIQVELIYVRPRISRYITRFLSQENKLVWFKEQAAIAYSMSSQLLESKGIPFKINHSDGVYVRDVSKLVKSLGCSKIVVCSAAHGSLAHLFEKTSTDELIGKGDMPVIVVPREHQSLFERWGIPFLGAGLAAGLATAVID